MRARGPSPASRRRRLARCCTVCTRSAVVRRSLLRDGRNTMANEHQEPPGEERQLDASIRSSRRSFTSSSTSAKRANARSPRTGRSVPTAGSGWPRTARAAAIRCRRPVRRPVPGVAWPYPRPSLVSWTLRPGVVCHTWRWTARDVTRVRIVLRGGHHGSGASCKPSLRPGVAPVLRHDEPSSLPAW